MLKHLLSATALTSLVLAVPVASRAATPPVTPLPASTPIAFPVSTRTPTFDGMTVSGLLARAITASTGEQLDAWGVCRTPDQEPVDDCLQLVTRRGHHWYARTLKAARCIGSAPEICFGGYLQPLLVDTRIYAIDTRDYGFESTSIAAVKMVGPTGAVTARPQVIASSNGRVFDWLAAGGYGGFEYTLHDGTGATIGADAEFAIAGSSGGVSCPDVGKSLGNMISTIYAAQGVALTGQLAIASVFLELVGLITETTAPMTALVATMDAGGFAYITALGLLGDRIGQEVETIATMACEYGWSTPDVDAALEIAIDSQGQGAEQVEPAEGNSCYSATVRSDPVEIFDADTGQCCVYTAMDVCAGTTFGTVCLIDVETCETQLTDPECTGSSTEEACMGG